MSLTSLAIERKQLLRERHLQLQREGREEMLSFPQSSKSNSPD